MELAGEVEAVGAAVTEFKAGDEVFGVTGAGAHAEFVCCARAWRAGEEAGRPELRRGGGGLRRGDHRARGDEKSDPREGRSLVVYGASGSIGTAAVQLARYYGAHVTAVCTAETFELVRSLGADEVVDYRQEDFTENGQTYDAIFDAVGKHSFGRCRRSLKPGGIYLETDLGFMWHVPPLALASRWIGDKRVTLPIPKYTKENVRFVKQLLEEGKYRAVIDRRYPLEDVVAATKYVETGQKVGNVVLTLEGAPR